MEGLGKSQDSQGSEWLIKMLQKMIHGHFMFRLQGGANVLLKLYGN